jgi:enamine deaminase RidA (YjgF/YER057c/UK114 family)
MPRRTLCSLQPAAGTIFDKF